MGKFSICLNTIAGILRSSSLSASKDIYCRSLYQFAVFLDQLAYFGEQSLTRKERASCRSTLYG
ncbi:hypothetical protein BCR37DRAFT_376250 [Protomyces lactucae-debilis]|uniref:Uncharacterized protein n=1 Tax=Protomyces lactucae-debilis TaxID=2754530 RepID=A0A1Y2FSE2_PROLT|nr:uncharacterized protein BCR37DRAFT_376250 [Protomyces lactucae-debilis]ORY86930.1 hypothetical protein BCR37DRAFT_376250 [Protomyces lactucae-debilis]